MTANMRINSLALGFFSSNTNYKLNEIASFHVWCFQAEYFRHNLLFIVNIVRLLGFVLM